MLFGGVYSIFDAFAMFYICYCQASRNMTFKKQQKATEKTVLPFELLTAVFKLSSRSWCIEIFKR